MRWFILATLLVGCQLSPAKTAPPAQPDLDRILSSVTQLVTQNSNLRREIAALKANRSARQRCLDDKLFHRDTAKLLVVCTETSDYVIAPLMGRYILFRGLGCGETFEDSFLMFKTLDDVNSFIETTLCAQKEQQ